MKNLLKPIGSDLTHATVKGALSSVPFLGGLLAEYYGLLISPTLEKRLKKWITLVEERLFLLEENKINIQSLFDNDQFIDLLLKMSRTAIDNHQQEKLECLANALVNTALFMDRIEEDKKLIFIDLINELTVSHIFLLKFIDNPSQFIEPNSLINLVKSDFVHFSDDNTFALIDPCELSDPEFKYLVTRVETINLLKNGIIDQIFPDYKEDNKDFYKLLLHDLVSKKLIHPSFIDSVHFSLDDNNKLSGSTKVGEEFVYFITAHINPSSSCSSRNHYPTTYTTKPTP